MNYIAEMNAFYDGLELNPLPSPCIALWHALMAIANKSGWQQEFTVALSVLVLKSGLNAKAVQRARNRLEQDGYITWKSRAGSQSAIYHINSIVGQNNSNFVAQTVPESVPQSVQQTVPESVPQSVHINKHKQKLKEDTKVSKKIFGKYHHVRLTEEQVDRLILEYGQQLFDKAVNRLDEYIQETGKTYKDHNLTIRRWVIDAVKKEGENRGNNKFNSFPQRNYSLEDYADIEKALLRKGRS